MKSLRILSPSQGEEKGDSVPVPKASAGIVFPYYPPKKINVVLSDSVLKQCYFGTDPEDTWLHWGWNAHLNFFF